MKEKNFTIVLTRVFSMFLIILCHIIHNYEFIPGNDFLGQIFNVGVYVFILISGYLYGNKIISNFKNWIMNRWKKIVIPIMLLVLIDIILLSFAKTSVNPLSFLWYALNLHGLEFISNAIFPNVHFAITNLVHTWFTTIIMMCYFLVPAIQKLQNILKQRNLHIELYIILSLLFLNFILTSLTNITFIYFIVFYIGYIISSLCLDKKEFSNKKYLFFTLITIIAQILRIYLKSKIDETSIYTASVALSHTILGLWIFISMFKINDWFPNTMTRLGNSKTILWLDEHSYAIYLTHGVFSMYGALNVYALYSNIWISSILFFLLTITSAYLLNKASNFIIQKLN